MMSPELPAEARRQLLRAEAGLNVPPAAGFGVTGTQVISEWVEYLALRREAERLLLDPLMPSDPFAH